MRYRFQLNHSKAAIQALLSLGLLGALAACRQAPFLTLGAAGNPHQGEVRFTMNVPRKTAKATRQVFSMDAGADSSLLVNQVNISLNGPGFLHPLYPQGSTIGSLPVQSGTLTSTILNVPTGKNRYVKVFGLNGNQKLNEVAGLLDVHPGYANHVLVSLATTATALVLEKLTVQAPDAAQTFNAFALQSYLDTNVTQPVLNDPTRQNAFAGYHPSRVNPQGIASYLEANNFQVPASFNAGSAPYNTFVLQAGQVQVTTDPVASGTRVWINDPTSAIVTSAAANQTSFTIDGVAPNFDPTPQDVASPAWTVMVMTPDGRVGQAQVSIPRRTLGDPLMAPQFVDFTGKVSPITAITLKPADPSYAGGPVQLNGRVADQIYAYAQSALASNVVLLPTDLDWQSLDGARIQIGNNATMSVLPPDLAAAAPDLNGLSLSDAGLAYPLGETIPGNPADVASITASLKAMPSLTGSLAFRISFLTGSLGQANVQVDADAVSVTPPTDPVTGVQLSLPGMLEPLTYTINEPSAPAGTIYHWVSSNPNIIFSGPADSPNVSVSSTANLIAPAIITVYSSTGRYASSTVQTAFPNGSISVGIAAATYSAHFNNMGLDNPASPYLTADGDPNNLLRFFINTQNQPLILSATDPNAGYAGGPPGRYFWRSSDPSIISLAPMGAPSFPTQKAIATAYRNSDPAHPIIIAALDPQGHEIDSDLSANFNQIATITATVNVPFQQNSIQWVTHPVLPGYGAQATFTATEALPVTQPPAFSWAPVGVVFDTVTRTNIVTDYSSMLKISPPAGQTFPNAGAVITGLREGNAYVTLTSAATGRMTSLPVTISPQTGGAAISFQAPSIFMGELNPVPPGGTPANTAVATLGQTITLGATDPADPSPNFAWRSDSPAAARIESTTATQAQILMLGPGPYTVRVINPHTGRQGAMTLNSDASASGAVNATVTL